MLTALSAATIAMAPFGGRLADAFGRLLPVTAGLSLVAAGASTVALTGTDIPVPMLVVALGVIGAGVGLPSSGLQASAVESVEPQSAGAASGVDSASRYMGSILGSTLLGRCWRRSGRLTTVSVRCSSWRWVLRCWRWWQDWACAQGWTMHCRIRSAALRLTRI